MVNGSFARAAFSVLLFLIDSKLLLEFHGF